MKPRTIYQTNRGKFLVLEVSGRKVVICPVQNDTTTKHRADYRLSYASYVNAGLLTTQIIACIPKMIAIPKSAKACGCICQDDFDSIRAIAHAEAMTMARECGGRQRVSSIYRW